MADLHFPRGYKQEGFAVQAAVQHDGSADPVVRELLQNCLDAARKAGRATRECPLKVSFRIQEWPTRELPGINAYRRAFDAACRSEADGVTTPAADQAIRRIRAALKRARTRVLLCTDNGHGLNQERMRAILSEGCSDKGGVTPQAGSFGLGHLTAFAASDLRYVLYGGRSSEGVCVSGHAIVASHSAGHGNHRAGEGFWTPDPDPDLHLCVLPQEIPPLLEEEMDFVARDSRTGTAICIVGFNDFRERNEQAAVKEIIRVAASNFVAAISRGEMVLEIFAEPNGADGDDRYERLDRGSLGACLEAYSAQQRSRRGSGGGWFPGAQAYEAWKTLGDGRTLHDAPGMASGGGTEVRFRRLDAQVGKGSRVSVFRNGMWITNRAPELGVGTFAGCRPFDAVVLLEEGRLFDLVRASEGPEHRGIDPKRLRPSERSELMTKLRQVAERLQEEAGEAADADRFRPRGFAVVSGADVRKAERLRPRIHRLSPGNRPVDEPRPQPDDGPAPRPDSLNPRTPKPGRSLTTRSALRALPNEDGLVDRLEVQLKVTDEKVTARSLLGLRLRQDSGSDASCDQPIPPDWKDIRSVEVLDGRTRGAGSGGEAAGNGHNGSVKEFLLPPRTSRFVIHLGRPIRDGRGIEIDIVHRKPVDDAGDENRETGG